MTQRKYAESTTVSEEDSSAEVIRMLRKHGCDLIMPVLSDNVVGVQFRHSGRQYRINYAVPESETFRTSRERWTLNEPALEKRRAKERARLWRVLLIKLKVTFEEIRDTGASATRVLFPFTLLPDGQTIQEAAEPEIDRVYATGRMIAVDEIIAGRRLLPPPQEP